MHVDRSILEASLRGVSTDELDRLDVRDAIARVVDATRALFEVDGAGMMLLDDASVLRYVVATDDAAHVLERVQEEAGVGPCVDALVLDTVVRSRDIIEDDRWPSIRDELGAVGIRAVLGLPITVAGTTVGSLNVYRATTFDWDESDEDALDAYRAVLEHVMTAGLVAQRSSAVVAQLQGALERRVTIDRAVGVIMGSEKLGLVDAFNRLRMTARARRVKATEVAEEVLRDGALR